jgi:DNA-directed RNA polymerase specialized sigma24 family protein
MLERPGLDRRPTKGPATSSDRDATLDTACRCYHVHEAQLLASARRHLRLAGLEHEDPEDVWRDAQLKILDQLSAGRRLVAEPGDTQQDAYLKYGHAVLKLHVNDLRKKAIRRRTDTTDTLDAQVGTADVWQEAAYNLALLDWRQALLARSERTRKVLAMTELGYSRQEIADELGVSVKRVGKVQEQGKPLRERVLAARGARRLREICGGLATRLPLPAGVTATTAKVATAGGIAAVLTVTAIGGVAGVTALEHHEKRPVASAEQGPAPQVRRPITTATQPPRTAVTAPPTATTTAPPRTTARTVAAGPRTHAPAPARANQGRTTTGILCTTQQVCRPTSGAARAPQTTPALSRSRVQAPRVAPAGPANLCVQQGLCR